MVELSIEAILQIDATVITGILILLTIGRNYTGTFEISKWTASVVLPFIGSAVIELFYSIIISPPIEMRYVSLAFMATGFIYIGVIILKLPKIRNL